MKKISPSSQTPRVHEMLQTLTRRLQMFLSSLPREEEDSGSAESQLCGLQELQLMGVPAGEGSAAKTVSAKENMGCFFLSAPLTR